MSQLLYYELGTANYGFGLSRRSIFTASSDWIWISIYDYNLKCTKCLRNSHVVEYRFLGWTYHKSDHLEFERYDLVPIFGEPCQHTYRTGGFGHQAGGMMADGETAEGNLFRFRWNALNSAFTLYKQFPNKGLLLRTFQLTDSIFPADATIEYMKNPKYSNVGFLFSLSNDLESAKSEQGWEDALKRAETETTSKGKKPTVTDCRTTCDDYQLN